MLKHPLARELAIVAALGIVAGAIVTPLVVSYKSGVEKGKQLSAVNFCAGTMELFKSYNAAGFLTTAQTGDGKPAAYAAGEYPRFEVFTNCLRNQREIIKNSGYYPY